MFFKTLFFRKSKIFWMMMIPAVFIIALLSIFALPRFFKLYQDVAPRVPIIDFTTDHYVTLATKPLHESTMKALQEAMPGVSVYQISPELALVGIAKEFIQENGKLLVKIRLFGNHASNIKDKSIFTVRLEAPSLNQFIDHIYHSKEGKALTEQAKSQTQKLAVDAENIWTLFLSKIKSKVDEKQFEKLKQDQIIKGILIEAFNMEIKSKIDFEKLKTDLLNAKELGEMVDFATSGLEFGKLFKTFAKSTWHQVGLEVQETVPNSKAEWLKLGWAVLSCQVYPPSCQKVITSHLNVKERVKTVGKDVASEMISQASNGILNHKDQAINAISTLAKNTNENLKLTDKVNSFFSNVFQNEALKNHLKIEYGEDLSNRLQLSLEETWQDPQTIQTVDQSVKIIKDILEKSIKLMVLDQNQSGPNPLLLSMIKEKLQRQQEVHINIQNFPNQLNQQDVPSGYIFEPKVDDHE